MKKKSWRLLIAAIVAGLAVSGSAMASPIISTTAIAEVAGDGEHVAAVALYYDQPLQASSVTADDYQVDGRTIVNASVAKDNAKEVVLQLQALPMVDTSVDPHPEDGSMAERQAMGHTGPVLGSHGNPQPLPVMQATVRQVGLVKTTSGHLYAPTKSMTTSSVQEPIVEDFQQGNFTDAAQNNATLMYNLYVPKHYDPSKKYPLVLFMHDAGCVSPDIKTTLVQGLGAITFASPEWQAEHPCFVLAPQYDTVIVNDAYEYGPELDRTIHLVEKLCQQYSIDTDRIYNTGQSMGGMTSIAMDVKYPDFFGGSYLIACKWNEAVTSPLGKQNIWAVVSQGDPGASPSMEKIMANLEQEGIKVIQQTMDTNQSEAEMNAEASAMIQPDCNHYLLSYQGGSHRSTWQHAYTLKPALEWLFAQHKNS